MCWAKHFKNNSHSSATLTTMLKNEMWSSCKLTIIPAWPLILKSMRGSVWS